MLIVNMARETGWGYTRLLGELRKLGIRKISRSTIKNILQAHDIEPHPPRGNPTWGEFVQMHSQTLWACDFFTKQVWTVAGLRKFHVLALIHVGTRRVEIVGITQKADQRWMLQRAREMVEFFRGRGRGQAALPLMVLRDRDVRFTRDFDRILADGGVRMQPLTPGSPNLNAFIERWIQSIKHECLDHFLVFGEQHLRHLLREYVDYYNTVRPHQGIGNRPIDPGPLVEKEEVIDSESVVCESRLGGLLKHYRRAA